VQLLNAEGALIAPDFATAFLPDDAPPGARVATHVQLRAPAAPGRYVLRVDLVDELITWFQDRGSAPCDCPLLVE